MIWQAKIRAMSGNMALSQAKNKMKGIFKQQRNDSIKHVPTLKNITIEATQVKRCVMNEEQYLLWLNSKGHSIVTKSCAYCHKSSETVIENVRQQSKDTYLCCNKCFNDYMSWKGLVLKK